MHFANLLAVRLNAFHHTALCALLKLDTNLNFEKLGTKFDYEIYVSASDKAKLSIELRLGSYKVFKRMKCCDRPIVGLPIQTMVAI